MALPEVLANDARYAGRLSAMENYSDIPDAWRDTPIEKLIRAENFHEPIEASGTPELLICACIEFRYALPIPRMFAYVIRRASGRVIGSEFSLAYVFSKGVRHIALIGHNDCGMTKVLENKDALINALVEQGWHRDRADEYVSMQSVRYAIPDELDTLRKEYVRLMRLFRNVTIAPLFVCLSDTKLYVPTWYLEDASVDLRSAEVTDEDTLMVP